MSTTRTYTVGGMTCGHCVHAVTTEIQAMEAVTGVSIELATGAVTVDSVRPLADAEISAALDEAGYELSA